MPDWEDIIREHASTVYRCAYRVLGHTADADDVVQEVFLEARERTDIQCWSAFLTRVATLRAIDRLRKRRSDVSVDSEEVVDSAVEPHQLVAGQELHDALRKALARLSPQQAQVFCLRYFEEQSCEQIADSIGSTVTAVTTSLSKARRNLRTLLEPHSGVQR